MEKHNDIIDIIKKQEAISPPDDIVQKVMTGAQKAETGFQYKLYRFLFQRRELSHDAAGILSGKVVSASQCFFLMVIVGIFYLLMGLFVLIGMKEVLANIAVNMWLRLQPYLAFISGCYILFLALIIYKKPQVIIFVKYGIIAHTFFIILNALIMEFSVVFPIALAFVLTLSALAFFLGVLIISSMSNLTAGGVMRTKMEFVNDV
jgi:hypothetical protein